MTPSSITVKPRHIHPILDASREVGDSVMLWGAGGIGKSALIASYANKRFPIKNAYSDRKIAEMKILVECGSLNQSALDEYQNSLLDQDVNMIDFRLASIEPTDLRGIPIHVSYWQDNTGRQYYSIEEITMAGVDINTLTHCEGVVWAPPAVFNLPKDWKGIIFMDEANQAIPVVQAAAYSVFLDHRIGDLVFPDGAMVIAAGNRDIDGGATFDMATPLRDRMTHLEMTPDVEDWVENYAIPEGLDATVVAYTKYNSKNFHTLSPDHKSLCGGSSPRSWTKVSDYRKYNNGELFNYGDSANRDTDKYIMARAIVSGRVGEAEALEYMNYVDEIMKMPDMNAVLSGVIRDLPVGTTHSASSLYGYVLGLSYRLGQINTNVREGKTSMSEFSTNASNYLTFVDQVMSSRGFPEFFVVGVRSAVAQGVQLNPSLVPVMRDLMKKYKDCFALAV